MIIDPTLTLFWILIAGLILTNVAWIIYVSGIEDELSEIYEILERERLNKISKKKVSEIVRRKSKK